MLYLPLARPATVPALQEMIELFKESLGTTRLDSHTTSSLVSYTASIAKHGQIVCEILS